MRSRQPVRVSSQVLERDLSDMEARRDSLAAFGDRPINVPQERYYDRRHKIEYVLAPRHSELTGTQLAEQVEGNAAALRVELERTRAELAAIVER